MSVSFPAFERTEKRLLTAEEFLDWLVPGRHADLIDGKIYTHSPVNFRHANLLDFLYFLMTGFVESRKLGKVYKEVVAVRLNSRQVFLPDLSFFTTKQLKKLEPAYAPFAPTLAVEVLSLSSARRDTGPKFSAYEENGVKEYWLLDPIKLQHRFYKRQGEFLVEFAEHDEIIHAQTVPGFWVRRSWLDPENLPDFLTALKEIGIG